MKSLDTWSIRSDLLKGDPLVYRIIVQDKSKIPKELGLTIYDSLEIHPQEESDPSAIRFF
jgi:hypothetical protein